MENKINELLEKYNKMKNDNNLEINGKYKIVFDTTSNLCDEFIKDLESLKSESMENISDKIKEIISMDDEMHAEYISNGLFNNIINDLIEADQHSIVSMIVNIIYSYNSMYCNILEFISKNTDENTVNAVVNQIKAMQDSNDK